VHQEKPVIIGPYRQGPAMEGQMTEQKITIKAAAHLLEVTTKTIQRYLAKGRLTKVKEGTRTFLLVSEVKSLRSDVIGGQGQPQRASGKPVGTGPVGDTVTLSRERYEQLLLELGELRKQNQIFMEFKGMLSAKEEGLRRLERDVEELRTRMQGLEMRKDEDFWGADPQQESQEPAVDRAKPKSRPKKPWWQA
jgi:hypothetical protein